MELSFGGHSLAFDHEERIQGFLDAYQPLDEMAEQIRLAVVERHTNSISGNRQNVGLPISRYAPPPRPRLNQIWWPTGATRWAQGFFLCGDTAKIRIESAAYDEYNAPLTFRFEAGNERFTADMWLLPPRPVTCVEAPAGQEKLWLLPLVDERYYWQFMDAGEFEVILGDTWVEGGGGSAIEQALSVAITADPVDGRYLVPDPEEFCRRYGSVAHLLDAAVTSVGQRLIRTPDGRVISQGWNGAKTTLTLNMSANLAQVRPWAQIAGNQFAPEPPPGNVRVVFPRQIDYVALLDKVWTAEAEPAEEQFSSVTNITKTIHSTAYADYTSRDQDEDPHNAETLQSLADVIAEDYYKSFERRYDFTFQGVKAWTLNAYDDSVLYNLGGESFTKYDPITTPDGRGVAHTVLDTWFQRHIQTRVQSITSNGDDDRQCSQDLNRHVLGKFQFGKMYDGLTEDGRALMEVWEGNPALRDGGTEAVHPEGLKIYVYGWLAAEIGSGREVIAWWDVESERWYVIARDAVELVRFKLSSNLLLSGSASANKLEYLGGVYVTGDAITVVDWTEEPGSWQGAAGFVGWAILMPDHTATYEIIWMETFNKFAEATSTGDIGEEDEVQVTIDHGYDGKELVAETIYATDRQGLFLHIMNGAKMTTGYDPESDKLAIFESQTKAGVIEFTLEYPFSDGESSDATIDRYYGSQQDVQDPTGTVTIWDEQELFPRAVKGAKGIAKFDAQANKYRAVACQQVCIRFTGFVPSEHHEGCGLYTTDVSFEVTIADVQVMDASPFNLPPASLTVEVFNVFNWSAGVGALFNAEWNHTATKWQLYQIDARCKDPEDCPEEE